MIADLKKLCDTCIEMKNLEREEQKKREEFEIKILLRKATPMEII